MRKVKAIFRAVRNLLPALAAMAVAIVILAQVVGTRNPTIVALTLLLVVLVSATRFPLWVATVNATVAMLAFNFFFLPPVGTFTIADPLKLRCWCFSRWQLSRASSHPRPRRARETPWLAGRR